MVLRSSGASYVSVNDKIADTTVGWWVEIYDHRFPSIWIYTFQTYTTISYTDTVGDVGLGTVTFGADDPIINELDAGSGLTAPGGVPAGYFTSTNPNDKYLGTGTYRPLLDGCHYWHIMEGGIERFRFIHEGTSRDRVKSTGDEFITISGRGRAQELEWGIVLPAGGVFYNKQRVFKQMSWAQAFQTLLDESQHRGEMSNELRVSFTFTQDSRLYAWADKADYVADIGTDLLTLLNTWSGQVGFEWHVRPDGLIEAAYSLGQDRSGLVVFSEGVNIETSTDKRDTESLRSSVYIEGADNHFTGISDTDAWIQWGNRATYIKSMDLTDATGRALTAQATLQESVVPSLTRQFKVPYVAYDPVSGAPWGQEQGYPRAYVDYGLTDTIAYLPRDTPIWTTFRVTEMTIQVDSNGQVDMELGLQTRYEQWATLQKKLLKKILAGNYTKVKSPFKTNPALDGLFDVNLTFYDAGLVTPLGPDHGATMRIDKENNNQWVPSPGEPTFFYTGVIAALAPKMRWYARSAGRVSRVDVSVGTAGSGDLVVGLWHNGIHFGNATLPAGAYVAETYFSWPIKKGDYLQTSVVSAGGQEDLTVQWLV